MGCHRKVPFHGIAAANYRGRDLVRGLVLLRTESTLCAVRKVWCNRGAGVAVVPALLQSFVTTIISVHIVLHVTRRIPQYEYVLRIVRLVCADLVIFVAAMDFLSR
jgi:hypothetical protein